MVVDNLTHMVTTVCTLKCKYCATLIPAFRDAGKAVHYPLDNLMSEIALIFKIYSRVDNFRPQGGESFLHPQIREILIGLNQYSQQFGRIILVTNGTYALRTAVVDTLHNLKYDYLVRIDDYGKHSIKLNELLRQCDENHIKYEVCHYNEKEQYFGGWLDLSLSDTPVTGSLTERFTRCKNRYSCKTIQDGKLWGCGIAASAAIIERFKSNDDDYVDLTGALPIDEMVNQTMKLGEKPFSVCAYCEGYDPENGRRIPAAEQL